MQQYSRSISHVDMLRSFREEQFFQLLRIAERFSLIRNCSSGGVIKNYTYKDAGVDIDAGECLVDAIKPLAASYTARSNSAQVYLFPKAGKTIASACGMLVAV